jgi:hypothetical protein
VWDRGERSIAAHVDDDDDDDDDDDRVRATVGTLDRACVRACVRKSTGRRGVAPPHTGASNQQPTCQFCVKIAADR